MSIHVRATDTHSNSNMGWELLIVRIGSLGGTNGLPFLMMHAKSRFPAYQTLQLTLYEWAVRHARRKQDAGITQAWPG